MGYAHANDEPGKQNAEYKAWVESLDGFLSSVSDDSMLVTYGGDYITDYAVSTARVGKFLKYSKGAVIFLFYFLKKLRENF